MTLLVRNEEDILPAFLAYHFAHGVDFIIATDNLSTDSTAAILKDYERKGLLHYIYESEDNYDQSKWVSRMARLAATEYHADWVINSDADEFWWPENHPSIKDVLATIPDSVQIIEVKRTNFLPLPEEKPYSAPFWETMTIRDKISTNSLDNPLPPKICHRAHPDVHISQGNHKATLNSQDEATSQEELAIFHFPLRSLQQFTDKIVNGGAAYERNKNLKPQIGRTWRELYKLHLRGGLDAYYEQQVLREPELSSGFTSGQYLKDTRLRDRLRELLYPPT